MFRLRKVLLDDCNGSTGLSENTNIVQDHNRKIPCIFKHTMASVEQAV